MTIDITDTGDLTATGIRPRAAILWNGVLLQELGIADHFRQADLTLSLGRTNPSKKFPAGKPKVGGATLSFMMPDQESALKFRGLLYADARPTITIGFGYDGGEAYWVGGAGVRRKPDLKKFAQCRGYKIDNVAYDYATNIPTLTLNGMAGRTLELVEHRRATVWNSTSLAKIAEGIADEHGIILRISGRVPSNQRVAHAVQFAGESRLDALERLARSYGAGLHFHSMVATAVPGASQGYQYVYGDLGAREDSWVIDQGLVRTVLDIRSIDEDFIDLSGLEQGREVVIGYAPSLSPQKFGGVGGRQFARPADFVASSVKVTEDNVARSSHSAAGVRKDGGVAGSGSGANALKAIGGRIVDGQNVVDALVDVVVDPNLPSKVQKKPEAVSHGHVSETHEDLGGDALTTARVQAALAAQGIKTRTVIQLDTGAPGLQEGAKLRLAGTLLHDGRYGVEEARTLLDASGGLRSTLTVRPVLSGSGGDGLGNGSRAKKAAGSQNAVTAVSGRIVDGQNVVDLTEFVILPGSPSGASAPEAAPDEVPATDGSPAQEHELDRQVQEAP